MYFKPCSVYVNKKCTVINEKFSNLTQVRKHFFELLMKGQITKKT